MKHKPPPHPAAIRHLQILIQAKGLVYGAKKWKNLKPYINESPFL